MQCNVIDIASFVLKQQPNYGGVALTSGERTGSMATGIYSQACLALKEQADHFHVSSLGCN
jgi:hypothetical protein